MTNAQAHVSVGRSPARSWKPKRLFSAWPGEYATMVACPRTDTGTHGATRRPRAQRSRHQFLPHQLSASRRKRRPPDAVGRNMSSNMALIRRWTDASDRRPTVEEPVLPEAWDV